MAAITGRTEERIIRIRAWLGLNENPDGDTKLDYGEAAAMRNFKVTRDGNLQRRPGLAQEVGVMAAYTLTEGRAETAREETGVCSTLPLYPEAQATETGFVQGTGTMELVSQETWQEHAGWYWIEGKYRAWKLVSLAHDEETDVYTWTMKRVRAESESDNQKVNGLWAGNVADRSCMVAACDGKLWLVHNGSEWCKLELGSLDTSERIHMFGFSKKLYLLNGKKFYEWDGTEFREAEGYRPLIAVGVAAGGGGTLLEQINKLNGKRRVWLSPDGTETTYQMPEQGLASVDYLRDLATGTDLPEQSWSADTAAGTVTFLGQTPAAGVNRYEVGYSVAESDREMVEQMRFSELFNGANDNRVFLYGDGSNRAIYSGLDYNGEARADYFPDMNVLVIGEDNTPITACIRHYSRLLVFKTGSAYSVQYDIESLADGSNVPAYYATPMHRALGNEAPGQVRLVLNTPITLHGKDLYEWHSTVGYSGTLTADERQTKRVSDKITATLAGFPLQACSCWDDKDSQEYYLCCGSRALVYGYAADAWYYYDSFPAVTMANYEGTLYVGDDGGRVCSCAYENRTDNGEAIACYWESGSMAFDREWMRKYSAMLWIGMKPETRGKVSVTVQTDRRNQYTEKVAATGVSSIFTGTDFRAWSFHLSRKPKMTRLKIKAKKFVFYKLILQMEERGTTATILAADLRVRYTGYAR